MCGISGWVSFDRDVSEHLESLDAMTTTVVCRGPDGVGSWSDRHVAFGHRRLAVIDPAGGLQPMTVETPQGPVSLTYAGEVYNFKTLRAELEGYGHRFHTNCDTEVIIQGYLHWGMDLPTHLVGMYAFAIWDGRRETLIMVRDRLGIKPIFYYRTSDGVLFGSEPKVILAHPLAERVMDLDGLRQCFSFLKVPGDSTWANIEEVRPGTLIIVDRNGISQRTYWQLEAKPHSDDLATTILRTRELLTEIVQSHLVADVPLAVLLSGGLDSSIITGLARRSQGRQQPLHTVAVDVIGNGIFKPDAFGDTPDAPFAADVATHVNSNHTVVFLDSARLSDPEVRRATITARDSPSGHGDRDHSMYLLFRAIREHSTVALSGEGADEIFGGYLSFVSPSALSEGTFPWLGSMAARDPKRPFGKMLKQDLAASLDIAHFIGDNYLRAVATVSHLEGESDVEHRIRELCHLHLTHFLPMLLDRKDRLSMKCALEVRVPYCDHRLVDYVFNVPWSMKRCDGREKGLLRAAGRDVLPQAVIDRNKCIYPSVQDVSYVAALLAQLQTLVREPSAAVFEIFDLDDVTTLARTPSEKVNLFQRMQAENVLNLHTWLDLNHPILDLA